MRAKPKDRQLGSFLLDNTVKDVLDASERLLSEIKPSRRHELLERILDVKALQSDGDSDKLGAACFHLGVTFGMVDCFRGKTAEARWVEKAKEFLDRMGSRATNRTVQMLMEKAGFEKRSQHAFDEWIRRNVRSPMRDAKRRP